MPFEGFWASQYIITSLSIIFRIIAKPRTDLLRKDNFQWSPKANEAFCALKLALSSIPVLVLPEFTNSFTIECNTPISIFVQSYPMTTTPIEFLSKPLALKHQAIFVYDKEMLAVAFAVQKWHSHLLGHQFKILMDHQTLKYFLDKCITTPAQEKWLLKLLGLKYTLEYRPDTSNKVADALFYHSEMLSLISLSQPFLYCIAKIHGSYSPMHSSVAWRCFH